MSLSEIKNAVDALTPESWQNSPHLFARATMQPGTSKLTPISRKVADSARSQTKCARIRAPASFRICRDRQNAPAILEALPCAVTSSARAGARKIRALEIESSSSLAQV